MLELFNSIASSILPVDDISTAIRSSLHGLSDSKSTIQGALAEVKYGRMKLTR